MNRLEMGARGPKSGPPLKENIFQKFSLIFSTGFSELKRKGAITRLNFEIKGLEKEKEKYLRVLGNHAWEAHVEDPEIAGIVVNLKELQIEINRLGTQFGEHEAQIRDIESTKVECTERFNQQLDELEQKIVPHRQKIESIHAEKEDNKIQMEELRKKQDHLTEQVRLHQRNIQDLDLGEDAEKQAKIDLEKAAIRNLYLEKSEIECQLPFLMAAQERLKIMLAQEGVEIRKLEEEKETARRDYESKMKNLNHQIHDLEEKKKQIAKNKEALKKEMEPFLMDLGRKVEQLRLQENQFRNDFLELDRLNREMDARRNQILEAESLSRAMDRGAWTQFLIFSVGTLVLVLSAVLYFFR